jgi:hypothetical protein
MAALWRYRLTRRYLSTRSNPSSCAVVALALALEKRTHATPGDVI